MPGVFLNEDDYNFDIALRRFKKQVEKAGILSGQSSFAPSLLALF